MIGMADLKGATLAREPNLLRLSLPPKEAVDKILRYETAIEWQLYRAVNAPERLQRRRQEDYRPSSGQRAGFDRMKAFCKTEQTAVQARVHRSSKPPGHASSLRRPRGPRAAPATSTVAPVPASGLPPDETSADRPPRRDVHLLAAARLASESKCCISAGTVPTRPR